MDADHIARLEEDNRRLRHLLDKQDASGELRHRTRSTLALLRSIVRRSADTRRDLPGYVAHLEDRLSAVARAQALADQQGKIDLRTLLTDELFQYGASEGEMLVLSGPAVHLQPKAGQVLALAIHELAVNAVEHGTLGKAGGRIEVSWSVACDTPEPSLLLCWTEHGQVPAAKPAASGFGTEVLTRMLAYELKAVASHVLEPGGLRCTITVPFPERVGRVADAAPPSEPVRQRA